MTLFKGFTAGSTVSFGLSKESISIHGGDMIDKNIYHQKHRHGNSGVHSEVSKQIVVSSCGQFDAK